MKKFIFYYVSCEDWVYFQSFIYYLLLFFNQCIFISVKIILELCDYGMHDYFPIKINNLSFPFTGFILSSRAFEN